MGELVSRRRRGIAGIVSMVVGAACLVWVLPGGTAGATHVDPTQESGNASCPTGTIELKVEPVESGTFSDGTLTVTLVVTGNTFSWTSNIGVDVVIVKGGRNSNVYVYDPEATSDTGLHAPINPKTGEPFGLSHVSFCYDVEQATTTTTAPTTSTTAAPTTSTSVAPTTSTSVAPTTSTSVAPTTSTSVAPTTSTSVAPTTSTTVKPTTTTSTSTTSTTVKPTTTTSTSTTSTTLAPTTSSTEAPTTSSTEAPTTSSTEAPTTSSTEAPTSTTVVAPSTTPTSLALVPVGQLPKTGSGSQTLLLVAGITLLLGGAALAASAKLGQKPLAEA